MVGDERAVAFEVLGLGLRIESNRDEALAPFATLLESFRVTSVDAGAAVLRLFVGERGEGAVECDGTRYAVEGGVDGVIAHAYAVLLHGLFARVEGFLLLHGAALSKGGRGWVVAGASGAGKSTLGCALAAQPGWELLSDDVAALSLEDRMLHPFPKAISLRPGAASEASLAGGVRLPVLDGSAKRLFRPDALGLRAGREPVPLRFLVFLEPDEVPLDPRTPSLSVVIHRPISGLLERVRALPDVRKAEERKGTRYVQLEIDTQAPARCLDRVEQLCRADGAMVIGTARESQRAEPDFDTEPRIDALGLDAAVRLFLRRLWGTAQYRLVAGLGGGAALYARVAAQLTDVRCLRLRPGKLPSTLSLLGDVAR